MKGGAVAHNRTDPGSRQFAWRAFALAVVAVAGLGVAALVISRRDTAMPKPVLDRGVAAPYARGWQQPPRPLHNSTDPREVFTVATFRLRRGAGVCTPFLSQALEDLPRSGAFVTITERSRESALDSGGFAPLPARLPPRPAADYRDVDKSHGCAPEADFTSWWIPFRLEGRYFYAHVIFGANASASTQREAWQVLEDLRVDASNEQSE